MGIGRHNTRARIAVRLAGKIFRVSQVIDGSIKTDTGKEVRLDEPEGQILFGNLVRIRC